MTICSRCQCDVVQDEKSLHHFGTHDLSVTHITEAQCIAALRTVLKETKAENVRLREGRSALFGIKSEDESWRSYEALFRWRDGLTDQWGNDLVGLLSRLGGEPPDFRLPPEHLTAWKAFGKLDGKARYAHAKAFVRQAESEHHFHNDAERDDEDDPMKIQINHDDQPNEVAEKISKALKHVGFELEGDGEEHEGFIVYTLRDTNDDTRKKGPLPSK